ncbi:MAG: hypothetical protein U5O39_14875 [Gammaproteobacteria bacterium]|nr:hypothetical protein [Gammaproteobacteria bacterium]
MHIRHFFLATLGAFWLAALPLSPAFAHGEYDEAEIAEFHLHMDDFEDRSQ